MNQMFYVEPDGRTITAFPCDDMDEDSDGVVTCDGRILDKTRLFAMHPDYNPWMALSDTGRYVYASPYSDSVTKY